ncbi:MAG: penicillin acylase family protein, partial [Gammaproteobacteria bacterium]|nr:penicillin acylase family protein [Gammaproteobacteria bacterium]
DVYVEVLNPEDPEQYQHNGGFKHFDSWQETILVRDAAPVTVTARRSVHGMVQQIDGATGRAWTRARAWEGGELDSLMAWVNLARDRSLDAVQQRLANVTTNINFYYMDRDGNLGYTHGGRYPQRVSGQDSRLPTPGTGEWDWPGFRPYEENPSVRNPAQGFIANWNNRPSQDWISSDTWSMTWSRAHRVELINQRLSSEQPLSTSEVWQIIRQVSFADVSAPFLLPALFDAWRGESPSTLEQAALKTLQDWDGDWLVDTQGDYGAAEALLETWLVELLEAVFLDDIGEDFFHLYAATNNPNKPLGASRGVAPGTKALIRNLDRLQAGLSSADYDFFNGADYRAVIREAFTTSLQQLSEAQGVAVNAWRIAAHPMQWKPYNFRGVPQALPDALAELPGYMNRGSENNLFIATGKGIEAHDVIPPGQSGFVPRTKTANAQFMDQLDLFAQFDHKRVPFTAEAVKRAAVASKTLVLAEINP